MKSLNARELRPSVAPGEGEGEGEGLGDGLGLGVGTGCFAPAGEGVPFGVLIRVVGVASVDAGKSGTGSPPSRGVCSVARFADGVGEGVGLLSGEAACLICVIDPSRPEGV